MRAFSCRLDVDAQRASLAKQYQWFFDLNVTFLEDVLRSTLTREYEVPIIKPDEHISEGDNQWAISNTKCNLANAADPLVVYMAKAVRDAYGERELLDIADPDPEVAATFNLQAITTAFRSGLPNPQEEGNKPARLRNSRSEPTEILGREAMGTIFGVEFVPALHAMKGNPNQPILGYDGWGLKKIKDDQYALVLYLVKGTEDTKRPPGVTAELVNECRKAPVSEQLLARHVCACTLRAKQTQYAQVLLRMLELLGTGQIPTLVVAPIVVRGAESSAMVDLDPFQKNSSAFVILPRIPGHPVKRIYS